jgi:hypothetical protein
MEYLFLLVLGWLVRSARRWGPVATLVHLADGSLTRQEAPRLLMLAAGAVAGAQAGAQLSQRVQGRWIMRALAVALGLVGIRILAIR